MRRVVLLGSLLMLVALGPGGAARADGPTDLEPCVPGMRDDGTFVVCGGRAAPRATYVLPRARSEHRASELRRTFTDEIVRSGDHL